MQTITTIGLGIAKSVFQIHGIDAKGKVIVRRQLKRRHVLAFFQKLPPCLDRSLRLISSLVARTAGRWEYGASDPKQIEFSPRISCLSELEISKALMVVVNGAIFQHVNLIPTDCPSSEFLGQAAA